MRCCRSLLGRGICCCLVKRSMLFFFFLFRRISDSASKRTVPTDILKLLLRFVTEKRFMWYRDFGSRDSKSGLGVIHVTVVAVADAILLPTKLRPPPLPPSRSISSQAPVFSPRRRLSKAIANLKYGDHNPRRLRPSARASLSPFRTTRRAVRRNERETVRVKVPPRI